MHLRDPKVLIWDHLRPNMADSWFADQLVRSGCILQDTYLPYVIKSRWTVFGSSLCLHHFRSCWSLGGVGGMVRVQQEDQNTPLRQCSLSWCLRWWLNWDGSMLIGALHASQLPQCNQSRWVKKNRRFFAVDKSGTFLVAIASPSSCPCQSVSQ